MPPLFLSLTWGRSLSIFTLEWSDQTKGGRHWHQASPKLHKYTEGNKFVVVCQLSHRHLPLFRKSKFTAENGKPLPCILS